MTARLLALVFFLCITGAYAQTPPVGLAVLNQVVALRAVTPSDTTVLLTTRGLHNGSATACNIAVVGVADTAAVTLLNVQAGADLPYSVVKVMSTNTTCTGIIALY